MDVTLPNLGEGADSGTVVSVLVKPGASVKKGQNLIELETGKAVAPIPSPADGTVVRLAVKEGDKLAVGQLIAVLEAVGGSGPSTTPGGAVPAPASGATPVRKEKEREKEKPAPRKAAATPVVAVPPVDESAEVEASGGEDDAYHDTVVNETPTAGPYVRRVARDLGIDLHWVKGTARSGQVTVEDLRGYVANLRAMAARPRVVVSAAPESEGKPTAKPAQFSRDFAQWGPVTRKPLTALRKTIAARLVQSATTLPTVTQFDEVDVTALSALRRQHAAAYEARGARLTLTSFVLKAVAATLLKHPLLNASLDEEAGEIVFKDYVHLGLAVDTEAGLLVPVIRDVNAKDLVQISKDVQDVAARARDRKIGLPEMQGGTFTISNQGGIGGAHFTPIINQPESGILGLGRGAEKPVVREGKIVIRTLMPVALTYDHRLIDGGAAARFMVDLVAAIEGMGEADVKL
ncbi:MAG: 2-oxo acid dehydrogenase subunit E2 [Verrucomicrobiales bacterium]|nr:2-oxo acid dehydrogenase subunit E2 [Verrucomicrobiales bacterium]